MNVQFATPLALLLLLGLPLLLLWELRGARRRPALRLSSVSAARALPSTWRLRLRWATTGLRLATLLLVVVALARPQSGQADALLPQEGIDIVLVLDTSSSMRTAVTDGEPRLAVAQRVLREFASGRDRDRLGLVVFRSRSLVLSPLTLDYGAFQSLVDQADAVDLPDGTAIGLAMTDALNLLRDSTARSRVVILLTDGDNNRPEVAPLSAARIAEALGVRVYTIGVTGGAAGQELLLSVNETVLTEMAELTDGRYFRATDPDTLAQVYDTIDALERSRVGQERFAALDELAVYLLAAAIGLLLAEVFVSSVVLRRMP